jgi:thiol-disulfide isomerase/thioredoxin
VRNEESILRDPASITTFSGEEFEFAFPDENGHLMTIDVPALAGKPKIVQFLGTWCPNCLDETKFLLEYLRNEDPDIAIVGLAFERHTDPVKARQAIARYRQKLDISYPILLAGSSDKNEASKQLPMLNKVFAFPTLIFIDSDNRVRKIHTGFNGPATLHYQSFKKEFHETVISLVGDEVSH